MIVFSQQEKMEKLVYSDGIGVSTHDGEIIITELQFAGKRKMSVKEYFNGVDKESLIGKVFE